MVKSTWQEISDILTEDGYRDIEVGKVLGFLQDEKTQYYRVMRKKNGKLWVKPVHLVDPKDLPEEP